jgi:hypothetical protein
VRLCARLTSICHLCYLPPNAIGFRVCAYSSLLDRLAVLFVLFLVYDVGLIRSGNAPLHASALLGPAFILVTLCQTIAITIEMNDDFTHWPGGLQATLADVSRWSLFLGHQNLADGSEVTQGMGEGCGLIGPVAKIQLALVAPFLCLACLIAYALLFGLIGLAAKLAVKDELLRIVKNAATMMATITTLFLLPFLRAVSAPQHCVSAHNITSGSTISVMKSDPTVVCYAEDDPDYAGSVYASAVALMAIGKLLPLAMILFVLLPSDLLGVLSNKYVTSTCVAGLLILPMLQFVLMMSKFCLRPLRSLAQVPWVQPKQGQIATKGCELGGCRAPSQGYFCLRCK